MISVVKLLDREWAIDQPSFLTVFSALLPTGAMVWPASTFSEKQTNKKKKNKQTKNPTSFPSATKERHKQDLAHYMSLAKLS